MDVRVVVQNIGTAFAVFEAVRYGKPLIERVVTVTGEGVLEPKNLLTKIGTLISHLIDECGGLKDDNQKVISGGPMMGLPSLRLTFRNKGDVGDRCHAGRGDRACRRFPAMHSVRAMH